MPRERREAGRDRDGAGAVESDMAQAEFGDGALEAVRDGGGRFAVERAAAPGPLGIAEEHRELVAADAEDVVAAPDAGAQEFDDLLEHLVAGVVAVVVVVALEVVDVEEHQAEEAPVALRGVDRVGEELVEGAAVSGAGEFVGPGEPAELLVLLVEIEPAGQPVGPRAQVGFVDGARDQDPVGTDGVGRGMRAGGVGRAGRMARHRDLPQSAAVELDGRLLARAWLGDEAHVGAAEVMSQHAHRGALHIVSIQHRADEVDVARRTVGRVVARRSRCARHLERRELTEARAAARWLAAGGRACRGRGRWDGRWDGRWTGRRDGWGNGRVRRRLRRADGRTIGAPLVEALLRASHDLLDHVLRGGDRRMLRRRGVRRCRR